MAKGSTDRIDPMPNQIATSELWLGCEWHVPFHVLRTELRGDDSRIYEVVVRSSDEPRVPTWELRVRTDADDLGTMRLLDNGHTPAPSWRRANSAERGARQS